MIQSVLLEEKTNNKNPEDKLTYVPVLRCLTLVKSCNRDYVIIPSAASIILTLRLPSTLPWSEPIQT